MHNSKVQIYRHRLSLKTRKCWVNYQFFQFTQVWIGKTWRKQDNLKFFDTPTLSQPSDSKLHRFWFLSESGSSRFYVNLTSGVAYHVLWLKSLQWWLFQSQWLSFTTPQWGNPKGNLFLQRKQRVFSLSL